MAIVGAVCIYPREGVPNETLLNLAYPAHLAAQVQEIVDEAEGYVPLKLTFPKTLQEEVLQLVAAGCAPDAE